ncbi:phage holin family protein [Citrobacter freundii]|uniref:phage holin family protein n=1 Tax=Citrobacter freundii TaxID=546 RepID=UPI0015E92F16|nr:phage holin family protein [Citrobacter freundii]QLZ59568.1 phage holin family protein [Citrobacter freundii]
MILSPFVLLQMHAVIALLAGLAIAGFSRGGRTHKWYFSLLAYVLALSFFSIPIRIWIGDYQVVDRSELVVNIGFLVVMILSRGNITGKRS